MKLQQLRYLLAIVDNGLNITAAAERLYTSQPGVSKQLKLLEEELGLQLFVRKGKSLDGITPAGKQVIQHARSIMAEVDKIRRLAADYFDEQEGSLAIAATHTQARYVLPDIVREFRDRYPDVSLNLHEGTSEQLAELMHGNSVDFAIATGSRQLFRDLLFVPAWHWERSILVPAEHELATLERELTLEDLARFPLVTYVFSFDGDSPLKQSFDAAGLEPDVVFAARDADVIRTYVRMGLGIGIVASLANDDELNDGLCAIDASKLFPRGTTWVGFHRSRPLRRYMLDFLGLFAPHLTPQQLDALRTVRSQDDIDALFANVELPVRAAGSGGINVAA